jgi:hypothetical protein
MPLVTVTAIMVEMIAEMKKREIGARAATTHPILMFQTYVPRTGQPARYGLTAIAGRPPRVARGTYHHAPFGECRPVGGS